ncbi:MAG: PfkB family carbohydrate kinase [Thiohalomonadaceae bacterium]
MADILVVGNATLDIVNLVDSYPREDDEVRASAQFRRRGGNAANTAVALAQLGHATAFAGTLADEPNGRTILDDLTQHGVTTAHVRMIAQGKVPTSYVSLSRATGSRTIVHYRDLPEYAATDFTCIPLEGIDWIHFEGRNLDEVRHMLRDSRTREPHVRLSLEAEKPRPGMEALFADVDVVLFSRVYARHHGFEEAAGFLHAQHARHPHAVLACGWGAEGAWAMSPAGELVSTPAFPPPQVVDTLGAGDVFNAGMIDALARGAALQDALVHAARIAGHKCGRHGIELKPEPS